MPAPTTGSSRSPTGSSFYGGDFHDPWTYGVPELLVGGAKQRERLVGATRIAAPGCNASTVSLSLAPGVAAGVIDPVRHRDGPRGRPVRRGQEPEDEPAGERDPRQRQPLRGRRHAPAHPRDPPGARRRTHVGDRHRNRISGFVRSESGERVRFRRRRGHPHLVHPRARADVARHPRDEHRTDRRTARRMPRSAAPGRPPTATRRSCSCCPRASSRAPPTCSVRTPPSSASRSTAPRTGSSWSRPSTTSSRAPPARPIQSMNIALGLPEGTALTVNGVAP